MSLEVPIKKTHSRISTNPWTSVEDSIITRAVNSNIEKNTVPWSYIANNLLRGTRTPDQCCQRWSRVLNPEIKKGSWEKKEDIILLRQIYCLYTEGAIFASDVTIPWALISKKITGRTDSQCRARWMKYQKSINANASKDPQKYLASIIERLEGGQFFIEDSEKMIALKAKALKVKRKMKELKKEMKIKEGSE